MFHLKSNTILEEFGFDCLVCMMLRMAQENSAMSAVAPGSSRIKDGSSPSNIPAGPSLFSIRSARRVARIVALCICLLTFAQLASALANPGACSSPQATLYRFTHFPLEEVAPKASITSSPSVLQCGKIQERVSPRPSPGRAYVVLGAFVQSPSTTSIRLRIPPSSSDDH
jgi:hypothetical protein